MQRLFEIDGHCYDVRILELKRSFQVLDTDNTGRVLEAGRMYRDIVGTFYNYTLRLDASNLSPEEYDRLYGVVSQPRESHVVVLPFGHAGSLTQRMYVTAGEDSLKYSRDGCHRWGDITLKFVAMQAERTPGGGELFAGN